MIPPFWVMVWQFVRGRCIMCNQKALRERKIGSISGEEIEVPSLWCRTCDPRWNKRYRTQPNPTKEDV